MLERLRNFHNKNRLKGQAEVAQMNVDKAVKLDGPEDIQEEKLSTDEAMKDIRRSKKS
ncbi:MAG: hypothetical protein WCH00_01215 [Candidatus Saccharibacteria bacterium]